MNATIHHNLTDEELVKALATLADQSEVGEELLKAVKAKVANIDETPKEPRHRATRELYRMLQAEFAKAARAIEAYAGEIAAVPLHKAIAPVKPPLTHEQMVQLAQAINDRYGFIAAQLQSVDYQPDPVQLERWKQLGLVHPDVTPATFAASIPEEMHIIRNAFLLGKFYEAVESGKTFAEVMDMARYAPLLKPDLAAIQIAEQQTAMYLTDNAADLATLVGQLAIKKRNETIRQMAVDFHARKLKRIVLDREEKEEHGIPTPDRPVETWQQFKSELHQTMEDKARDWDRVAFYEITDAQKQGQAHRLMEDGNVGKLVYKVPMSTACAQCKHTYLLSDGKTPRLHRLSDLVNNGTNIGRKAHPTKGGKVVPGGRPDGQETMKAVSGLMHPWCQCGGPYEATGYEDWLTEKQKAIIEQHRRIRKSQMSFDFTTPHHVEYDRTDPRTGKLEHIAARGDNSSTPASTVIEPTPQEKTMETNLKEQLEAYKPEVARQFISNAVGTLAWLKRMYGPDMRSRNRSVSVSNSDHHTIWERTRAISSRDENGEYHIDHYTAEEPAKQYADATIEEWGHKITSKLKDLQNATVHHLDGFRFAITGERDGKRVSIEQDMIVNRSSKGTLFNQFPARIYVDGKFHSEAAYKKLTGDDAVEKRAKAAKDAEKRAKNMLPSGLFAKGDKVKLKLVRKDGTKYETEGTVTGERNGKTVVRSGYNRFNIKDYGIETEKLARWNGMTTPDQEPPNTPPQ